MKILSNSFLEKEESEKIDMESFLFEKKVEEFDHKGSEMDPVNIKNKLIDWEALFENLAGSQDGYTWSYSVLKCLSILVTYLILAICLCGGTFGAILSKSRNTNQTENYTMIEDDQTIPFLNWQNLFWFPILFGFLGLLLSPEKYKHRRHFSDIHSCFIKLITVFTFVFAVSIFREVSLMWFTIIMTSLIFNIGLNFFIGFINAQKATKLRFDPCKDNNLYTLVHTESKDKGIIRIVESSVFKITLKNIGSGTWDSEGFVLHRHTGTGKKGKCFSVTLPGFTFLKPNAQVDLIPETADYDGECVRIPWHHCFGLRDRYFQVKTFISSGRGSHRSNEEDDDQIEFCSYKTKVAEHVAIYREKQWSTVTPC